MSGPPFRLLAVLVLASACAPPPPAFPCNDDQDCATDRGFACDLVTSSCTFIGLQDGGDADRADAGGADGGPDDAGRVDGGPDGLPDAGLPDAGRADGGPDDAGPDDAGPADAGFDDAGPADAGPACPCAAPLLCGADPSSCLEPTCGNGLIDDGEACDDANFEDGDGCESCLLTPGWRCERAPSVCALSSAIVEVSADDEELESAMADVANTDGLTHVFIDGSTFAWRPNQNGISLSDGSVTVVGYNGAVLSAENDGPVLSVSEGAELTLIGVHLRTESGTVADEGVVASDEGTVLRIIDSVVGPTRGDGIAVTNDAHLELLRTHVRATNGDGVRLDTPSYRIENSIVTGCGGRGLYSNAAPDEESFIRFSTFGSNGGGGVSCNADNTPLDSVISWGNGGQNVSMDKCVPRYSNIGGIPAAGTNISAQPFFVNPGALNYRLSPGSPGIDEGDPAAYPERDFDARLRPAGAGPDMGAHEVWP